MTDHQIASGPPTGAVRIPVVGGPFALVDAVDAELISTYHWRSKHGYAWGHRQCNGHVVHFAMHHLLCPTDLEVDHINRDTLDNRRCNLRPATRLQNKGNVALRADNKSGYRGVHLSGRKWVANIHINKRTVYLGTFPNPEDAARAFDAAAIDHFGEFAWLNFPESSAA